MPALKDICTALGNTPISDSPLWSMPVDQIVPAQLTAFRARLSMTGQQAQADEIINQLLHDIAHSEGWDSVKALRYIAPRKEVLLSSELTRGFEKMKRPMPAAILFGLETKMRPDEVVTLTWQKVKKLAYAGKFSDYAKRILFSQPINIASNYVFWTQRDKRVMPLFGMEQEVFDVFGKVWGELRAGYENLLLTDLA